MKASVKKKWVKALLSKKYRQTRGQLRDDGAFCCLGVLCDVHRKVTGKGYWRWDDIVGAMVYKIRGVDPTDNNACSLLPQAVANWAGVNRDPILTPKTLRSRKPKASSLNDDYKWDFRRIAEAITQTR